MNESSNSSSSQQHLKPSSKSLNDVQEKVIQPIAFDENRMKIAVSKIMARLVPPSVILDESAINTVAESTLQFLSSLTCEAMTKVRLEMKNTTKGDDVLYAIRALGYENYVPSLEKYLSLHEKHMKYCGICNTFSNSQLDQSKKKKKGRKSLQEENGSSNGNAASSSSSLPTNGNSLLVAGGSVQAETKNREKVSKNGKHVNSKVNGKKKDRLEGSQQQKQANRNGKKRKNGELEEAATSLNPSGEEAKREEKKNRTDWLNPEYIEEFQQKMAQAFKESDPSSFLRTISKEMKIPYRLVTSQFQVLKQQQQEEQTRLAQMNR